MDTTSIVQQEIACQQNLLKAYTESKTLFIRAEEILAEMNFFVAPILEHRDALEHIMRYMVLKQENSNEEALKQLDRALSHEIRAFFDIADFICVTIRDYIAKSLHGVKISKINDVWGEYIQLKENIVKTSEEIAEIRINRKGTIECIDKYKDVIDNMFKIYKEYLTKIEPKVRKTF